MTKLLDFLKEYPEGTHIIIVNEDNEPILNDQKGWALYSQRIPILQYARVLDFKEFQSNLYYDFKRMQGVKIVVGTHES